MLYGNLALINKKTLKDWFYLEMVSHRAHNDLIQTHKKKMDFLFFSVCFIFTDCSRQLRFDKKQKRCIKRIHLVTDGLRDHAVYYKVKSCFYSLFMKDLFTIILQSMFKHFFRIREFISFEFRVSLLWIVQLKPCLHKTNRKLEMITRSK